MANLSRAHMVGAELSFADLSETNMSGRLYNGYVNLRGSKLRGANLTLADMRGAYLRHADFGYANLAGCDLSGALIKNTVFCGANLENAIINIDTLISLKILTSLELNGTTMPNGILYGQS
jgi:uncharacterized protein YjbI with pentapeptide repeats